MLYKASFMIDNKTSAETCIKADSVDLAQKELENYWNKIGVPIEIFSIKLIRKL